MSNSMDELRTFTEFRAERCGVFDVLSGETLAKFCYDEAISDAREAHRNEMLTMGEKLNVIENITEQIRAKYADEETK